MVLGWETLACAVLGALRAEGDGGGGVSKQDYGTPWEFIRAVEKRFGPLVVDLAAREGNAKAKCWVDHSIDSLTLDWNDLGTGKLGNGHLWCNPPFANITPWAAKCAQWSHWTADIFLLTPASVGSRWFAEHVHGKALVLALSPRLTFEGCTAPYPKDCILSVYGETPGFDVWRWK